MTRLIRRTLTITIQERWTFGWVPGQSNDDLPGEAPLADESAVPLALLALVELLPQRLGLPAEAVRVVDGSIQIILAKPPKEATDEEIHP